MASSTVVVHLRFHKEGLEIAMGDLEDTEMPHIDLPFEVLTQIGCFQEEALTRLAQEDHIFGYYATSPDWIARKGWRPPNEKGLVVTEMWVKPLEEANSE